jgi:hypothetical protein
MITPTSEIYYGMTTSSYKRRRLDGEQDRVLSVQIFMASESWTPVLGEECDVATKGRNGLG